MSLSIGRKGWAGIALESTYGVPVNPTDYVPFTNLSLNSMVNTQEVMSAYAIRDKNFSSVATEKWSAGDIEMLLDPKIAGYFIVGAMGTVATNSLGNGNYDHFITRNNTNVPQSLSLISDRVTDRQLYAGMAVDTLTLSVSDGLGTLKASMVGQFPQTSVSGSLTTASGTVYGFKDAFFAFGTTVSGAQTASNMKLKDFQLDIKNNVQPIFRHGSITPDTINPAEFEVTSDFTVYFENTTDRDTFHNTKKQAASFKLTGAGLAGGLTETLYCNLYQTHIETFQLETGLANFYAEKVKLIGEYDNNIGRSIDFTLRNTKSLYI